MQIGKRIKKACEINTKNYFAVCQKLKEKDEATFHQFHDKFFNSPNGFSAFLDTQIENYTGETDEDWELFVRELIEKFKSGNYENKD